MLTRAAVLTPVLTAGGLEAGLETSGLEVFYLHRYGTLPVSIIIRTDSSP